MSEQEGTSVAAYPPLCVVDNRKVEARCVTSGVLASQQYLKGMYGELDLFYMHVNNQLAGLQGVFQVFGCAF